jgi:hypothetical protein
MSLPSEQKSMMRERGLQRLGKTAQSKVLISAFMRLGCSRWTNLRREHVLGYLIDEFRL